MPAPVPILIGGAILVVGAAILAGAWLASGRMIARRVPDPHHTPGDLGLSYEEVSFSARDGVRLAGRLTSAAPHGKGERAVVVFCAGMFGSMDGDTDLLPIFIEAGLDVLQFDWRAHGLSEGEQSSLGLREVLDAQGALDWLDARGIRRIGLMGFSFGGSVALRAAALDGRAACTGCDGGFVHLTHAAEGLLAERVGTRWASMLRPFVGLVVMFAGLRLGGSPRLAEPLDSAGRIAPRPVLLIHGAEDPIVPVADQDEMFAACRQPKSLWRVEGAGHRQAYIRQPDEYRRHVIEFFTESLS